MQQRNGTCQSCNKSKYGLNAKGVCPDCTYFKNHNGKTRQEVANERIKSKSYIKPQQKVYRRKKTGELDLFKEIWGEREHVCKNCKDELSENVPIQTFVSYFSHQKSKGAYPELRLNKTNIDLNCPICHHLWDHGDKEKFYQRTKK